MCGWDSWEIVKVTGIKDDGTVKAEWQGRKFDVRIEDTTLMGVIAWPESWLKLQKQGN